jgi:hypothetical protein
MSIKYFSLCGFIQEDLQTAGTTMKKILALRKIYLLQCAPAALPEAIDTMGIWEDGWQFRSAALRLWRP